MQRGNLLKNVIILFISAAFLAVFGCKATPKPGDFVESLRNPTSFPEIYKPEIKYIDEIVKEQSLTEEENIKVVPLGQDKSSSIYLFQIGQNEQTGAHYHKSHDEIVYIKKGSGMLEIDGTRHSVKEGMVVMIPRASRHNYVNTGDETNIAISIFSPPFDGKDIKVVKTSMGYTRPKKTIYDKAMKKSKKEMDKEKGEGKKWFGLLGKDGEEESGSGEEGEVVLEEQKILVLTEEGRKKIRDAGIEVKEKENTLIDKIVLDEKLKMLQKLRREGLISGKDFEAKMDEIIKEGGGGKE
ncbi:MAG: cupin domain-containing protein [Planctomycetota bacterium]|jgi:quercetin dioxygenase-like cupin family protein